MEVSGKTKNKNLKALITSGAFLISFILDIIVMFSSPSHSSGTVWSTAEFWADNSNFVPTACMIFLILFCVNTAVAIVGVIKSFFGKKMSMWPFTVSIAGHGLILAVNEAFNVSNSTVLMIFSAVAVLIGMVFSFAFSITEHDAGRKTGLKSPSSKLKKELAVLSGISSFLVLSLLYVPFCSYSVGRSDENVVAMGVFSSGEDTVTSLILFVLLFVFIVIDVIMLLNSIRRYSGEEAVFSRKASNLVYINTAVTGAYFLAGVLVCSVNNSEGKDYTTYSYIPFLISVAIALICAYCTRNILNTKEKPQEKTASSARLEMFIFGILTAAVTVIASLTDIIKVSFREPFDHGDIHLNGFNIFMTYNSLESGFQLVAFVLFAILAVTIGLFVASLIAYISRSKLFYKITMAQVVSGVVFSLVIGLFGQYYEIVQRINEDMLRSFIADTVGVVEFESYYKVESQAFYWFIFAMVIVVVMLIRKPYSRGTIGETPVLAGSVMSGGNLPMPLDAPADTAVPNPLPQNTAVQFDPCPAFTELDGKTALFASQAEQRRTAAFPSPTLPELVRFIVNYARDCRLHLSYTTEDIADFVAGLGATRLTILQGMSGTGKTSLPKIFAEAIMGNCEIIEVESSWRDKNELLGYYNEFSKTYTPKKFTQALYKAGLNPDTLTFIVLDEMNLSRIEYYFSDFLSLMENEEDKRELKLLNVGLYRAENGKNYPYKGLRDGHTVKIPNNIWFIGTANRDESTFDISDKVYDRAHTMNFNKRASKPQMFGTPIEQRYLSVGAFSELLKKAENTLRFDIDNYPLIKKVEALLEPYNISFGNRIANQIESFVSIYCSCFTNPEGVLKDAVEKILLSKVVCKLEFKSVENKEQLAAEFEKLELHRCSEFILKLNED